MDRALNLPNFITLVRVILVPVVFWLLITGETEVAFVLFIIAGISDAIDGYLAKTFGWQTELGAYLDPLADKLLIVSIFLALGVDGKLPLWLVIAVVSRDILIVIAVLLSWVAGSPDAHPPAHRQQGQYSCADRPGGDGAGRRGLRPRSRLAALHPYLDHRRADFRIARCLFAQLAATYVRLRIAGGARLSMPQRDGGPTGGGGL